MKDFLKDYKYYFLALGINMVWNPYPIVGFVRDGLGIGPSGAIFTALFMGLGLFILIPINIFQKVYEPNKPLLLLGASFVVFCIIYLQYYPNVNFNYYKQRYTEWSYWGMCVLFMIGLFYYPDEKTDKIVFVTMFYALFASLGLAAALYMDPDWKIGARAGIAFRNGGSSNPHVYAYSAVSGFVAALVQANYTRSRLLNLVCWGIALFQIIIILLCRSASAILSWAIVVGVYVLLNRKQIVKSLKTTQAMIIMASIFIGLTTILIRSKVYWDVFLMYGDMIVSRYTNMLKASTGMTQAQDLDMSSKGRVKSYQLVIDELNTADSVELLLGQGYKRFFLDIPVLESLLNYGIIGFVLYNSFLILLYINCAAQALRPTNMFSLFLAYNISTTMVTQFFNGRPTDLSSWLLFAIYIRFIGIYYKNQTPKLQAV